ncbi:parathyroid hormone-related protein-like [Anguilla anguilla]|uniref:parathyroid hormone-related protein-like n=1 Tax=Anguilla anguilla TaxID=7936 RepID=UPI0015B2DC15|nr:parathyroid hormone-related protein-like [Anguilla anguilla]XP_035257360.1 parathyroid hormone-related protein-like [Anguilla anguilla]XP_035257362.1 parathyroid hormone-related protein-like [Anguilla anguilla]
MVCFRRLFQQWSLAVFLLCSPVPHDGRPTEALSGRMKRSVTHAQLMHDKGRTLQDFKRRMWLQELLDEVHTAEIRELPERAGPVGGGGGVSVGVAAGGAATGGGATGGGAGGSSGGSTLHPKPAGSTKNYPIGFRVEEEGTNLPQETNKSLTYKDQPLKAAGKKKKKGRSGKRRENEKKRRRARSLGGAWEPGSGGPHPDWRPYLSLVEALH